MSYDHALTLSDTYIRNMEKLENEHEIAPFLGLMMVDYCNQVTKINKPENCSPLTVAVLDDVNRHLLSSEHFSISEIAIMLGFSSHAHFQTVFKRITGMTPSAYRKQCL